MKRLGLLVALGFSLWPVVFIGWVFLAPHSETSSQQAVTTQTTKAAAPTAKDDSWKGRSIGGSENSKGDSNSGGDASSGSGKYRCPFYQAGRATELKSALNRLERKLKRIKGKADAGSATQAEIEEFNRLLPTLKERNQAYNRFLKRECVEE